mgnify:CR=1 FL=1
MSNLFSNRGPGRRRIVSNETAWMSVAMAIAGDVHVLNDLRVVEEWMIPIPLSFLKRKSDCVMTFFLRDFVSA